MAAATHTGQGAPAPSCSVAAAATSGPRASNASWLASCEPRATLSRAASPSSALVHVWQQNPLSDASPERVQKRHGRKRPLRYQEMQSLWPDGRHTPPTPFAAAAPVHGAEGSGPPTCAGLTSP